MEKFKKAFKKYWVLLFLIVPFLFVYSNNKIPDNDIWFLLACGRHVYYHGIPHIDPFTIHEGLHYIMQQWGSASIFYKIYNAFGGQFFNIFIWIMLGVIIFILYKLFKLVSKKGWLAIIGTILAIFFTKDYIVLRPQIFSYPLLFLEIFFLEKYALSNDKKYLYPLPIISFLISNLHGALWYFQYVFMLPFIINAIKIKKFKFFENL